MGQSSGCSISPAFTGLLDQPIVDYRDMVWARRAFNMRYGNDDRRFIDDHREGFLEGYCAVAAGGDGYVPALPPDKYLGYQYQSPEGSLCVNAWFEGFPLGAAAAKKDGAGSFRSVYMSNMANSAIQLQKQKTVLPRSTSTKDVIQNDLDSKINPELMIDAPPKPVTAIVPEPPFSKTIVGPSVLKFGRLDPMKIPVDPSVDAAIPMTFEGPGAVQTAAGFDTTILR